MRKRQSYVGDDFVQEMEVTVHNEESEIKGEALAESVDVAYESLGENDFTDCGNSMGI